MADKATIHLLPELLLDRIFGEIESSYTPPLSWWTKPEDHLEVKHSPMEGSHSYVQDDSVWATRRIRGLTDTFCRLLKVCKRWKPFAERRLYRSITIGSTQPRSTAVVLVQLLTTLQHRPDLACLVQELRLLKVPTTKIPQQHAIQVCIISACTQLSSLTLIDFAPEQRVMKMLRESLARLARLRSLVFVQRTRLGRFKGGQYGLCSETDLLQWMSRWHNIQHVVVLTNERLPPSWDNIVALTGVPRGGWKKKRRHIYEMIPSDAFHNPNPRKAKGSSKSTVTPKDDQSNDTVQQLPSFPHLHTFSLLYTTTSVLSLRFLRTATPSLKTLRVNLDSPPSAGLYDALSTWAPTLETLFLDTKITDVENTFENEVIVMARQLSELRILHASSVLIPAHTLPCLTRLETLEYVVNDPSHLQALIDVIPVLPSLRQCKVLCAAASAPHSVDMQIKRDYLQELCTFWDVEFDDHTGQPPADVDESSSSAESEPE